MHLNKQSLDFLKPIAAKNLVKIDFGKPMNTNNTKKEKQEINLTKTCFLLAFNFLLIKRCLEKGTKKQRGEGLIFIRREYPHLLITIARAEVPKIQYWNHTLQADLTVFKVLDEGGSRGISDLLKDRQSLKLFNIAVPDRIRNPQERVRALPLPLRRRGFTLSLRGEMEPDLMEGPEMTRDNQDNSDKEFWFSTLHPYG